MLVINELKLKLDEDESLLKEIIEKRLRTSDFKYTIYRKSLDSREEPIFVYSCLIEIQNEDKYIKLKNVQKIEIPNLKVNKIKTDIQPIIIGYGPSGMFSAYRLIEAGIKPIIIEKGKRIKEREKDIELFFKQGIFNKESNVVYGEGGAGTFSDAKLTSRVKDPFVEYILDVFIKFGANQDIKYETHAHIGTDEIRKVITRMTDYLIENGAIFHFEESLTKLIIKDNIIKGIITNKNQYQTDYVLLGVGHSSEDLMKELVNEGVYAETKDFAIGFRVEHPQELINDNQYHGIKHPKLPNSEYFLRYKGLKGIYSFCMCPGGYVVISNHREHSICTNGMSYHARDNKLANSAILIQINKDELADYPLSGFDYLKQIEDNAYNISSSYKGLSQNIKDYLNDELNPLIFDSSLANGTVLYNFNKLFSEKDNQIMKEALRYFDSKIKGFINNGIMVGPETRSSSPIRLKRNTEYESINTKGLYPMGEGAGYGGGIISCSLDGIKIANKIIEKISV